MYSWFWLITDMSSHLQKRSPYFSSGRVNRLMLPILRNMRTVTHIPHTIRTVIAHRADHNAPDVCNKAHLLPSSTS